MDNALDLIFDIWFDCIRENKRVYSIGRGKFTQQ
jgi:hypothetical protein